MTSTHSDYRRLTEAVADVIFSSKTAGLPVYCLPDRDMYKSILTKAGLEDHGKSAFTDLVKTTLYLDQPRTPPFRWHVEGVQRHAHNPRETPPALPLLVVLASAAELMQADRDYAAHNYYSRLFDLLGVAEADRTRTISDYRKHAKQLWGSLNLWLEAWEGERGIPTAYAVGSHDYIGLAISQAVVRQHDRDSLRQMFVLEGFAAGQQVMPSDMAQAMEPYVDKVPSPLSSHLTRLWENAAVRDQIVEAACLELESWDGSGVTRSVSSDRTPPAKLLAWIGRFPRKQIKFNLLIPYPHESSADVRFKAASGEVSVPTNAGPGNSTWMSGVGPVDFTSLLMQQIDGYFGPGNDRPLTRSPRRVVPLRWDDLQGAYVETETVALGEDVLLLVHHDARARVEEHLVSHAREGWEEVVGLPGLPELWLAYERIQILSAPSSRAHFDVLPLVPRSITSLTVRGGFRLPGLLRKWSSLDPPEVLAVAANANTVTIRLYDGIQIDPNFQLEETTYPNEVAVLPLSDKELVDGDYLVGMFVDAEAKPSSTTLVRLRSAATPRFTEVGANTRLVYSQESSARWPISANAPQGEAYVDGARTHGLRVVCSGKLIPIVEFKPRPSKPSTALPPRISVGNPVAEDSCLITGSHKLHYPPAPMPGERRTSTIVGECTTCGTLQRSAGTPWAARRRDSKKRRQDHPVDIPKVVDNSTDDLSTVIDALNHIGNGSLSTFRRVAAQVDGSGYLADKIFRTLEVLGHIDVQRNSWLQPSSWTLNSPTLVPVRPGVFVLIGERSSDLVRRIQLAVGADVEFVESLDASIPRLEVRSAMTLEQLAGLGVTVLPQSPSETIARSLPPLSAVADSLERIVVPRYRTVEFWDTNSASWVNTDSMADVGAYRIRDFSSTYAIRSGNDLQKGTIGVGNAQLVKHIANLWAGDALAGYHSRSQSVLVPLGADLPGLYGRALTLCSGLAPIEFEKHRFLQYPAVPRNVADIINTQMSQ